MIVLCCCLLISACTTRLMGASMISTEPVQLHDGMNLYDYPGVEVVGVDSSEMYIIPLRFSRIKKAVKDALEKGQGDLIINATVYEKYWWFLYGQHRIEVHGTVINTKGNRP